MRLVLDTGATNTLLHVPSLLAAGYGTSPAQGHVQVQMGSGGVSIPVLSVFSLRALGQRQTGLLVGAHMIPPGANADGLLGLDFFRGRELTIDFRCGQVTLP